MSGEETSFLYSGSNGHASLSKPHAVVFPIPGQGHINPMLHLSKRLASQYGFSITFVNLDFSHRLLISALQRQDKQADTSPSSPKLDINFVSVPDGIPAEYTRTSNLPLLCKGVLHSSSAFERLLAELRPPPTCVISDVYILHTQDAANKLGIPRIGFWTQSAACFAAHVVAARRLIPSDSDEGTLILRNIAGAPPLRFKDLPGFLQAYKEPADFMFNFCIEPFTRLEEAHCVLMNTFEGMEGEALETLRQQVPGCSFYPIGPTLPLDYFSGLTLSRRAENKPLAYWAEDYSCLQWLDAQQEGSVLYVSFGSIMELSEQELAELAMGLEATCVPVLWVLRPGVQGGGHAALPPGLKERTQGQMLIIEYAPQLHVLAHPSIGAFFTHAGWNSTLEGVSQGKPLLGYPYLADQMLNCRCIEDLWGVGLALERHGEWVLTRCVVESKVRALMSDLQIRKTALLLRDAARRAINLNTDVRSSTSNLKAFVNSLKCLPNICEGN